MAPQAMSDLDSGFVTLGDFVYRLDARNEDVPPYRRFSRSLFGDNAIIGGPGESLRPEMMTWNITNFDSEGQLIIDHDDEGSGRRFYQSEGLDFRVPGQFKLNRSTMLGMPTSSGGSAVTTFQGNADFTDVTGTSTGSGTDRRLNAVGDIVKSTNVTPGATRSIQADFYLYHEAQQVTTTQGSSFDLKQGQGEVSGTDFTMRQQGTIVGTTDLTGLTAGVSYEVDWYAFASTAPNNRANAPRIRCQVREVGTIGGEEKGGRVVIGSPEQSITGTSSPADADPTQRNFFTPQSGKTYQIVFFLSSLSRRYTGYVLADRVSYGPALTPDNKVTISVYNETGAATVATKTITVTDTSAGILSAAVTYTSAVSTDYSYRVSYADGGQRPSVDKVVETYRNDVATGTYAPAMVEIGQGGSVWLVGTGSGTDDPITWTYDFSTEAWTTRTTITDSAGADTVVAVAHTDTYEYLLTQEDKKVFATTTSAALDYTAAATATPRGMCIAQNRLLVLGEDSTNGVVVCTYAVDGTSDPYSPTSTVTVSTVTNTPDATLRQRMVGTPTGGRFFVNFGSVTTRIYECDTSQSVPTVRVLAELPDGVKATSIEHSGGITFIAGQFLAESTQTPVSALWALDQNGVLTRVGYFRRDDSVAAAPVYMEPYQNDLWILQGNLIWRYSLITGGLFLEYEMQAGTATNARSLCVTQGHVFATFAEGVWIAGSVGTYRTSGAAETGTFTSSINDFGLPFDKKLLYEVVVLTDSMASGTQVKVEYQIDQTGTWNHLGTVEQGTVNRFPVSTGMDEVTFGTLQIRAWLGSTTGTATPVVKGITARALPTTAEDFFELALLLVDEDSQFHADGRQSRGSELAANLWSLRATGTPATLVDAFGTDVKRPASYLVRIESIDHQQKSNGEGTAVVRCRVLT